MTNATIPARWRTVALIVFLAVLAAGCANVRRGVGWPALDTVTIDGQLRIMVAYENRIRMINPETGRLAGLTDSRGDVLRDADGNPLQWEIEATNNSPTGEAQFFAAPMQFGGDDERTLLFPTYSNKFLEFDLSANPVNTPVISLSDGVLADVVQGDGLLYVPYRSANTLRPVGGEEKGIGLVAFDSATYDERWWLPTQEGVWASPLLQDGVLYVPSIDHFLYAVDAQSGEQLWTVDLEGAIASTPLYHDGSLYVGSYSHNLYKINRNGAIVAQYQGQNWIWSTPVIYEDVLYYADLSGSVYALHSGDLSLVWSVQPADTGRNRGIRPSPIVTERFVIVASRNGHLYWLDRDTGAVINDREMRGTPEILSDLLLVEEDTDAGVPQTMIVAGSTDNRNLIAAFWLENSLPAWVYPE